MQRRRRQLRNALRVTGLALALCASASSSAAAAEGPSQAVRVGSAPALPSGARSVAPLPGAKALQLTVALKSQDPVGLANLAGAVSTPSSPLFRHYLGVGEFARRFGATPAQIGAVRAALQAQGLTVGAPTANDLTLPVRGTTTALQRAFSISLSQVELASGRSAYANAQAPAIPASIASVVQGVVGLDDLSLDRPQQVTRGSLAPRSAIASADSTNAAHAGAQILTGGPQPCLAARELQQPIEFAGKRAAGLTADQIATAYQLSSLYGAGDLGAGQTIALFEQEAFVPADLAAYQACYGTSTSVTPIDVDGGPEVAAEPSEEEGIEAGLDIEQIIGLAPATHVLVYQGPGEQSVAPVDIISRIVSDDDAKVISSSWGVCEALTSPTVIAAENTLLQEAAAQGQSFYVSSGDSGSEQCSQVQEGNQSLSVLNPASQPFATGVGGTTLYSTGGVGTLLNLLSASDNVFYSGTLSPHEGVWNDGLHSEGGSSGGGVSQRWPMPSYQSSAAPSLGVINPDSSGVPCAGSGDCREVPDVSADADPNTGYVVHVEGGWTFVGGTSASAPLWAAFTVLADASPGCRGIPIGFANPSLYEIAGTSYAEDFRDVTEASPFTGFAGNNPLSGAGLYPVTAGYDMTTGIGAPIGPSLAASLCALVKAPEEAHGEPATISTPALPATPALPTPIATPAAPTEAAQISSAQLKARLVAQLAPSGKAASIAKLLGLGGFSLSFAAPEAGSLAIGWYQLPRGAKLSKSGQPKPVLVASGRVAFTAAGRRTIRLALTGAGRSLLKRAKQIRLTASATFTPRGRAPVTAAKAFLLRR
jgi:subtilase family serine protease